MIDELVHGGEHIKLPLRFNYDNDKAASNSTVKKPVAQRKLMQKDSSSKSGLVEAKDVGNDVEYLVSVGGCLMGSM